MSPGGADNHGAGPPQPSGWAARSPEAGRWQSEEDQGEEDQEEEDQEEEGGPTHTVLVLQNSLIPSEDSSRPYPERLTPPKGRGL